MKKLDRHKKKTILNRWMDIDCKPGLVSVIIPTYNRSKVLEIALESVWNQTYRPIEVLVIDDGSTDNTQNVVANWEKRNRTDAQFKLMYIRQRNAGACAARNRGLIESKGEFIQFLDSDDYLVPERFAKKVTLFEKEACDLVHSGFDQICGNCGLRIRRYIPYFSGEPLESYLEGALWGNTWDFMDRRTLCYEVGPWDESLPVEQDRDYVNRRLLLAKKVGIIPESLLVSSIGGHARISDIRRNRKGWESRLHCEKKMSHEIRKKKDLPVESRSAYVTNLYIWAVKTYGLFPEIALEFGQLADRLYVCDLGSGGKRMRRLFKAGRLMCSTWVLGREAKRTLKTSLGWGPVQHTCCVRKDTRDTKS